MALTSSQPSIYFADESDGSSADRLKQIVDKLVIKKELSLR